MSQCVKTISLLKPKVVDFQYSRFRRSTHVTPKSFLSFVEIYKSVYKTKVVVIAGLADRMEKGLEKLEEAEVSVNGLRTVLIQKELEQAVASAIADKVILGIR